jgi:hypothetical protein
MVQHILIQTCKTTCYYSPMESLPPHHAKKVCIFHILRAGKPRARALKDKCTVAASIIKSQKREYMWHAEFRSGVHVKFFTTALFPKKSVLLFLRLRSFRISTGKLKLQCAHKEANSSLSATGQQVNWRPLVFGHLG